MSSNDRNTKPQQGETRPQSDVEKQRQQQQENARPAEDKEGDKPTQRKP